MDKKHKQIKKRVQKLYSQTKAVNDELRKLRKECEHPEHEFVTHIGYGTIQDNTKICAICGEVMSNSEYFIDEKNVRAKSRIFNR